MKKARFRKILLIMKISTFLLFFCLTAISAESFAQNFSFEIRGETIKDLLAKIEGTSDYKFLYRSDLTEINDPVTVSINDENIESVLTKVFSSTGMVFKIFDDNLVVISKVNEIQQQSVTGRVTDATTGEALPAVTVTIKGTTTGTLTDVNGSFVLPRPESGAIISFSFIGYTSREIVYNDENEIEVNLMQEDLSLDEVVVVGYGTKTKSSVTGAISTVGERELENISVTNVASALQGRVSGAFVTSESGQPGAGSNIYFRGPMSISGGRPLYVVDGVPINDLSYDFNMVDIESISVLKDASAAAIYGATAAGGVILVTTKRGAKQKPKVSFDGSYGVRNVIKVPTLLQRDDYIRAKELAGYDVVDLFGPESGWSSLPDTDWFDEWYNPGAEQNYNLSMSGGSDASTYYLSGNYNSIKGTRLNNWIERFTFRANSDHQITKKLKLSENIYFKYGKEAPPIPPHEGFQTYRSIPVMSVYDPDNESGGGWGMTPKGFQGRNYVAEASTLYARNNDYSLNMNGSLDYEVINDLHLKGLVGAIFNDKDAYAYQEPWFDGSWYALESFSKANSKLKQYIATFTLNYNKTFGGHQISGLLGYEARSAYSSYLDYANQESFVSRPRSSSLALGVESQTGSFWETDVLNRILSQFVRLEYSYQDKYLLTANVRRDGYGSKFGPENKYGIFPGVSVGWVLTKEPFMNEFSFINLLKLRAGYGVLGNPVGQDFAYTRYYTLGYTYDWSSTSAAGQRETGIAVVDALANAEIQWESVATTNIGLDASLWKGRLAVNLDFYSRQTQKMLYNVGIPPSAGVGSSVQANIGQMNNTGLEIQVEHRNDIGDFNYFVVFNGGFNKNKLISLNPDLERLFITSGNIGAGESGGGFYGGATICRSEPGLPLGQFYGYETAGIYATDAEAGSRPTYSGYTPQAGDLIYVDQNDDGVINASDQVYIGNPWPKMTYGFNLGGGWKNIEVRAQFNGTIGNDIYNGHDSYEYNFFSDYNTSPKIFDASFFGDNGLTDVPRSATLSEPDRNKNWGAVSDYHIYDGSYLRLKNLQVSYTLPESVVRKMHMSYIKVFFSADNLLTITKYPGLDPEIAPQANYGGILAQGIDFPSPRYPLSRIISFGVNMTF